MAVQRTFLDWDEPVTVKVRKFLLPADLREALDLSRDLVVVPTRQAGRRLREELANACAERGTALLAARVVPPSFFVDHEGLDAPLAGPLIEKAVWTEVFRKIDPARHRGFFPVLPRRRDVAWALGTGEVVQRLRETLAEGAMGMADVVGAGAIPLQESERWQDLLAFEKLFLDRLSSYGFRDACQDKIRTARDPRIPDDVERIVVAAVPDPAQLVIEALEKLKERCEIRILIHAPEGMANHFDAWGRPLPDMWERAAIDIPGDSTVILPAGSPVDQASKAMQAIATHADGRGPHDVAVGTPDSTVIPALQACMKRHGLVTFDPSGRPVSRHGLYQLFHAVTELAIDDSYAAARQVFRHPDFLRCLRARFDLAPLDVLRELDEFQNERLPFGWDDVVRACRPNGGKTSDRPALGRAVTFLARHISALRGKAPAAAWRHLLETVYAERTLKAGVEEDDAFSVVAGMVDEALKEVESQGEAWALFDKPGLALTLLRRRLRDQTYSVDRQDAVLDLEGWLELPWNDASLMVVTGMNEGVVPDGQLGDVFLPDTMRVQLGLHSDRHRLARDAYLMRVLIESRRKNGSVCFVFGKTGANHEPLKPSRLLFRCPDSALAARTRRLFSPVREEEEAFPASSGMQLRPVPRDVKASIAKPVAALSVTALKDYLACPFRFYLRHVLHMEPLDDLKSEMDALDFGNLIHLAWEALFRNQALRNSTDQEAIAGFLTDRAEAWVRERFGRHAGLPVRLGLHTAVQRLQAAARSQAKLADAGWEMIRAEERGELTLNGVTIHGKIDRVDRHRDTGRLRIIDYKSSDTGVSPKRSHLGTPRDSSPRHVLVEDRGKKRRWLDLQLPLYTAMVGQMMQGADSAEVAYFNLPKAVGDTGVCVWDDFTEGLRRSALACAGDLAGLIARGVYWPPAERVPHDLYEHLLGRDAEAAVLHEDFAVEVEAQA